MLQKLHVRKVYETYSEAKRIAEMLGDGDEDGWTYRVRETRDAEWVIAIFDDENQFVEYWG